MSLGEEVVMADSGREGELVARVGWVEKAGLFEPSEAIGVFVPTCKLPTVFCV